MIKMIKERSTYLDRNADGREVYRAQLIADTAAELTDVTELRGKVLVFGSVALTADGKALMLDSSNTWHDLSDGSEVSGNG